MERRHETYELVVESVEAVDIGRFQPHHWVVNDDKRLYMLNHSREELNKYPEVGDILTVLAYNWESRFDNRSGTKHYIVEIKRAE